MGFVKTPEEIERIQHALSTPRFVNGEMLSVEFLTDPAWLASILPPPLEPADTPRLTAMVSRWQSNCVGDFAGSAIYVSSTFDGVPGEYVLAMWMGNDMPLIYGRDLFGEPKKISSNALYRKGRQFNGWMERGGTRLIEIHADLQTDLGAFEAEGVNYNFKARPAANGIGLEEDAILTRAIFNTKARVALEGSASLTLNGTIHDPLDEIPIVEVIRGTFLECDLLASCQAVATTPKDVFLPYHHGRHDDWSALDTESAALIGVA